MSRARPSKVLSRHRRLLGNPYAFLNGEGGFDEPGHSQPDEQAPDRTDVTNSRMLYGNPYAYLSEISERELADERARARVNSVDLTGTHSKIAQAVRDLQRTIWRRRNEIWPDGPPTDPVDMLEPSIAADLIGFKFQDVEFLGDDTAGIIDSSTKRIQVSHRYPPQVRRFTAAHELGHAMLHRGQTMHRDRPLDGSDIRRDTKEKEADKFATFFLMPEKLVRGYFERIFGASPFVLTEDTAFALNPRDPVGLMRSCASQRDLARILAKAEYFNGKHVNSMAVRFRVSVETMAIRIEELGLLM